MYGAEKAGRHGPYGEGRDSPDVYFSVMLRRKFRPLFHNTSKIICCNKVRLEFIVTKEDRRGKTHIVSRLRMTGNARKQLPEF